MSSNNQRLDGPHQVVTQEDPSVTRLKMVRHSLILEHPVRGYSLETVLKMLFELAEETREGILGSIMLVDSHTQQLRHGASVSLLLEYIDAIDGLQIGPSVGSCGTAAIVDSSDDAILSRDVNGIIQSWNPAAERIYGYSADEVIGRPITMLIPEDRLGELIAYQPRLKNGERIEHFETVRVAKDGTRVDVILTLSPLHDADGNIVQFVDVQKNITSSKRDQTDLQETRRQHSMLLRNLLGAAFRCRNDENYSIELVSDGIESVRHVGFGSRGAESMATMATWSRSKGI